MFRIGLRRLLFLTALAPALVDAALAQDPDIRPRVVVSWGPDDTRVNETAVAASYCTDHYELVAMWNLGISEALGYAVSHDGGQTWHDQGPMDEPNNCSGTGTCDPTVAPDPLSGDFVGGGITKCPCDGTDEYHVFLGRKPCSGDDFTLLDPNDPLDNGEDACCKSDFPHIASGPGPGGEGSYFYVTSHTGWPPDCAGLRLHKSTDAGVTWSSRTPITDWGNFAVPVVASDGTLNIAYNALYSQITLLRSDDGGETFFSFDCAVRENTGLDNGNYVAGTFPIKRVISMAVEPGDPNDVYVVFDDLVEMPDPPTDDADVDVFLLKSTDGGANWSDRIRINDDSPNVQQDQFFPAVTVDSNGYVHVIWYDTRHDPQPHTAANVKIGLYYARSTDGGDSFTNYMIDDQSIDTRYLLSPGFIGDYNSITMVGSDTVVVVYMGTSHLRLAPPLGGDPPVLLPDDEAIFCTRILW